MELDLGLLAYIIAVIGDVLMSLGLGVTLVVVVYFIRIFRKA